MKCFFQRFIQPMFLIFLFTISSNISGQGISLASPSQYQQFSKSTTYVVQFEDPFSDFSDAVENAMKRNWTLTEWQMISEDDFERMKKNSNASFLFLSEIMAQGRKDQVFNILNVVLGTEADDINRMPDLGSVPLSYVSEDEDYDEEAYLYKIDVIIRFVQYYIDLNLKQPGTDIKAVVSENSKYVQTKEIWFLKEELADDVNSAEEIAELYSGKIRIVEQEEIEKAISEKLENVLILHLIAPPSSQKSGKCLKFLISVADGAPYYYGIKDISPKAPALFLAEDFKKL